VIVVDTSALLAILNKEPERDHFLDILANDDRPMLSAVTLYETMLIVGARRGPDNLDDLAAILETVEAEVVPFDADQARGSQAVYMRYGKSIHPAARLNLCDCVAYALAKHLGAPLLFKGEDFKATDIVAAG
jgi:ribonuclease VapC